VIPAYNAAAHEDLPMAFDIPIPKDLKVRRGLGILEELIQEKNPDFFKI
jgi:N-glycosylase/DNA lyase